jgi:hypothetical protein
MRLWNEAFRMAMRSAALSLDKGLVAEYKQFRADFSFSLPPGQVTLEKQNN